MMTSIAVIGKEPAFELPTYFFSMKADEERARTNARSAPLGSALQQGKMMTTRKKRKKFPAIPLSTVYS